MSNENEIIDDERIEADEELLEAGANSGYTPTGRFDAGAVHQLGSMYQSWFLDYASYVILERAVPNIQDGLKPVQRRILHSMKRIDDGRFNKVANIVGHTMQFHPHGDASIGDALVQLGQKELLIDTQGNWGNILTGDRAAAPRYIEARLTKFALDVVFNPKTTNWQASYDGRNKEPITLPVKFPLLLAQGAEGIAVGLSSKILPHNFNDICDAAVAYLRGEDFQLYPDFPTGGLIDVSKYNDGQRGGSLRVRAKIEKVDNKTLVVREVPFSKTAGTLIESILKAVEKGKIKAKHVADLTSKNVEIQVQLLPGVSSDKMLDALYAFSDCEISISPNCCVIDDKTPRFITVKELLKHSVDHTLALLKQELEIRKAELQEQLFFASLEKIFIEERMYKAQEFEQAANMDAALDFLDSQFEPFKKDFIREITRDDLLKLMEIKMQRILKFSTDKAEEAIKKIKAAIKEINRDLKHMVEVTINWFEYLKGKYGADHPRRTEIRNFDTISAVKVAEANEKLYIDRQGGFIGTGLKKNEFVSNCSDIDDVIVFWNSGHYKIMRVADKIFVGPGVRHVAVFKKNDERMTYNVIYQNGKKGYYFAKRFNVTNPVRDREYDLTQGVEGSKIIYFTANSNGEAEVLKIVLEPNPKMRRLEMNYDFSALAIKGRTTKGNLISKVNIHRISVKSHGRSTLGGLNVFYDADVKRINYDGNGMLLGEFNDDDLILVLLKNGDCYFTDINTSNHYDDDILRIEKFSAEKIWTAVVRDYDNEGYVYLKRFVLEPTKKRFNITGENTKNQLLVLTDYVQPQLTFNFGNEDAEKEPLVVDATEFISVKSVKPKGKRVTTLYVESVDFEELAESPSEEPITDDNDESPTTFTFKVDADNQMTLFDE